MNDQEIRAKALELKFGVICSLALGAIIKGRAFDGHGLWKDGDLEDICEYIKTGKKPEPNGPGGEPR